MLAPARVAVPEPLLVRETTDVFGEVPLGMTPKNAIFPLPPSVSVFVPFPEMRRFCEMLSVWLEVLALIVVPPVEPPMAKTLFVVSVIPVQVSVPALEPPPRVIVPLVPKALFDPLLPILATVSPPFVILTGPLKLFAVFEMVTVPAPDLLIPPDPLMTPDRVAVLLALGLEIVRLFERMRLLVIVREGRLVPVGLIVSVGVVAPLLVKASVLPEMVSVGAVPLAGPTEMKFRLFSVKLPAMSLFEIVFAPAAWVALKMSAVSAALAGVALQLVPALHCVVEVVLSL